jgi:hypothetical protein
MNAPEYRFFTYWRVLATEQEVSDVLTDARELPRWWPAVYLDAEELEPGDERGVGKRVRLHTKGWFPYTLDWELRVKESRSPHGFTIEARGDLVGTGDWDFEQSGAWTLVTYDWSVRAESPLLRLLSPVLRPLFEANHRWAMRTGEESLRLELSRRRAATASERAKIPPPPGPTTSSPVPLIAVCVAAGAAAWGLARLLSPRPRRRRRFWR